MMVYINLLPVRQGKKREMGRQWLILALVVVVGAGVGNWFWYSGAESTLHTVVQRNQTIQSHIDELRQVIGQVDHIKQRQKDVEAKLKVLAKLEQRRGGPVRMMDALSDATPKKVWLTDFEERNGSVVIHGQAFTHDDVAEFMKRLGNMVWTPKGIGQLIEQRADARDSRVELFADNGRVESFPVTKVSPFFTNINLKKAAQKGTGQDAQVTFDLSFKANYAI